MTQRCLHQRTQSSRRRGAALLIVLAALMVTMTAAAILLSAAADVRLQRNRAHDEVIAHNLLVAAEGPIQHWLETKSQEVVLPAESASPATGVLHDCWMVKDDRHQATIVELTITAFDQLGMVPAQVARSGSPLRLSLPAEVLACLDRADLPPVSDTMPLGLDLFTTSNESIDIAVFPESLATRSILFGEAFREETNGVSASPAPSYTCAIGSLIATHNTPRIRININTAPLTLVEAALRAADRGGLEQIVAARSKQPPHSAAVAGDDGRPHQQGSDGASNVPQVVTNSDCWAFRIDIRAGALLQRSWWAIYMPAPDNPNTATRERWACVQRLPITQ